MIANEVLAKFKEIYGEDGDIRVYFAPGRVNLIGEHTDYNGGHVFPSLSAVFHAAQCNGGFVAVYRTTHT